jgi:hypothetical protein
VDVLHVVNDIDRLVGVLLDRLALQRVPTTKGVDDCASQQAQRDRPHVCRPGFGPEATSGPPSQIISLYFE